MPTRFNLHLQLQMIDRLKHGKAKHHQALFAPKLLGIYRSINLLMLKAQVNDVVFQLLKKKIKNRKG